MPNGLVFPSPCCLLECWWHRLGLSDGEGAPAPAPAACRSNSIALASGKGKRCCPLPIGSYLSESVQSWGRKRPRSGAHWISRFGIYRDVYAEEQVVPFFSYGAGHRLLWNREKVWIDECSSSIVARPIQLAQQATQESLLLEEIDWRSYGIWMHYWVWSGRHPATAGLSKNKSYDQSWVFVIFSPVWFSCEFE